MKHDICISMLAMIAAAIAHEVTAADMPQIDLIAWTLQALGRGRSVRQARQIWRCADGRSEVAAYVNSLERSTKDRHTAERLNVRRQM
jgi:hypothetical protein